MKMGQFKSFIEFDCFDYFSLFFNETLNTTLIHVRMRWWMFKLPENILKTS